MDIPTETRARVRLVPNDAPGVGVDVASPRRTVTRDDERVVFLERHGVTGAVCLVERNPVTMARLSQVVEAGRERGLRGDDLRRWLAAGVMRADPMTTKRKAAGESGTEAT